MKVIELELWIASYQHLTLSRYRVTAECRSLTNIASRRLPRHRVNKHCVSQAIMTTLKYEFLSKYRL